MHARSVLSGVAAAIVTVLFGQASAVDPPGAFVGAQGFGAAATGGRGGDVYHVTNLNDSGPGSLRHGINNTPGDGRTIVFDVGGWIDLGSKLGVTRDDITIAGQTAPGGVGLRGDQFSVGAEDIVVRHMRFRPGKDAGRVDAVNVNKQSQRVIFDHVSTGFSFDENFSTQADELTLQYSSVAYGMVDHSAGSLINNDARKLSFHHNLYGHNETRNPKTRADVMDWVSNVVYNYHNGFIAGDAGDHRGDFWKNNFDNNTFIADNRPMMTGGRPWNTRLFFGENAFDGDGDGTVDPTIFTSVEAAKDARALVSAYDVVDSPFDAPAIWQQDGPRQALQRVMAQFGATPWDRDAVDALLRQQVENRTGERVSHENQLPLPNDGFPALGGEADPKDSDGDGMADAWEIEHGLDPHSPDHNGDFDSDGFTNLEEYLRDIAPFPAPGTIQFQGGRARYARAQNWSHNWQPGSIDEVEINRGRARVESIGQHAGSLTVAAHAGDAARLTVSGGELRVANELTVGSADGGLALLNLEGGSLHAHQMNKGPEGFVRFTGGTLHAETIGFSLTNEGGTLAAGKGVGTTEIQGELTLESGALEIEIGPDDQHDMLAVAGEANLGGDLVIEPRDGFSPDVGTEWPILKAQSVTGEFDAITDGFQVRRTGGDLTLIAALLGDMNGDGELNNLDINPFVLALTDKEQFREDFGLAPEVVGDINGDGRVNNLDINPFVNRLSDASSLQAMPEPASLAVVGLGGIALLSRARLR